MQSILARINYEKQYLETGISNQTNPLNIFPNIEEICIGS